MLCYDCNWGLDQETLKLWLLWRLFVTKKQDVFKGATLVYAGSLPSQHRRSAWIQIVWKLGALCVLTKKTLKKTFFYYTITLRWSHQVYFVSTLPIIIYLCLIIRMIVKGQYISKAIFGVLNSSKKQTKLTILSIFFTHNLLSRLSDLYLRSSLEAKNFQSRALKNC